MEIGALIALISSIVAAAPSIVEAVNRSKAVIDALFTAKVITIATQNAGMAFVDAVATLWATNPPPHWQVDPDPA